MPTAIPPASSYRRLWLADLLPVLLLAAVTAVVFQAWPFDLDAARALATAEPPARCFTLQDRAPWVWFYRHVGWVVSLPAVAALGFLALTVARPPLRRYRLHALIVILSFALGPGVVVNVLLKERWGRPRPRDVQEFGGRWEYRAPLSAGIGGRGKSFPCGHSSAGYALGVFYFLFRRKHRSLAVLSLLSAVLLGSALGFARMAAGAHFLSDVLWSFYLTWLVSWALYYFVFNIPGREDAGTPDALRLGRPMVVVGTLLVLGLIGGALFATPLYAEFDQRIESADVHLWCDRADIVLRVEETDAVTVRGTAEGFALAGSRIENLPTDSGPVGVFYLARKGLFTELQVELEITLPASGLRNLRVGWRDGLLATPSTNVPPYSISLEHRGGTLDLPGSWRTAPNVRIQAAVPDA